MNPENGDFDTDGEDGHFENINSVSRYRRSEERQPLTPKKTFVHEGHIILGIGEHNSDLSDEEYIVTENETEGETSAKSTPKGLKRRTGTSTILRQKNPPELSSQRPALTVADKHEQYQYTKPLKQGFRRTVKENLRKQTECTPTCFKDRLFLRIPIIEWILHYNLKTDLVGDIIAGVTVAVMHIPQGMAYAMLANLDPISGIYMAFFPVLFYALFASSRHCSMGTFAVICLMTGKIVMQYATFPPEDGGVQRGGIEGNSSVANGTIYSAAEVSTIVCFGVAIWQMIFGFLNLGSLTVFLSDMLVSGFTTGAAVQVLTSQVKSLFGVTIDTYSGSFQVILTWKAIFTNILESNPATMIISLICIIILVINNEIIKPRLRKLTRIPIPIELIVVVCGALASKYGHLDANYGVQIVGDIPTGLPPPVLPPFELLGKIIMPCLTITVVSFSVSYSMAKLFAKKRDYPIDATQELYATGIGNVVGSLFQCAPISASLSRSLIQESVGGATQLTSLISCSIIILVLLFIGSFFETLPNCVLGAIIVTALKGMFMQFRDFTKMWKISRVEASVWMISFLGVVLIDIDYGLFLGIIACLVLLIYRSQVPTVTVLGRVPNTDIYLDKDRYALVQEIPELKMLHVAGSLHFANTESFRQSVIVASGVDPKVICKMRSKDKQTTEKDTPRRPSTIRGIDQVVDMEFDGSITNVHDDLSKEHELDNGRIDSPQTRLENSKSTKDIENILTMVLPETKNIIWDLSGVGQMDISGALNLSLVRKEYSLADVSVHFASLSESCLEVMEKCGALAESPHQTIFHSIHDAVFCVNSHDSQTVLANSSGPSS